MMQHIYKERVKNDGSIEEGFKNLEDIVKRIYPRLFQREMAKAKEAKEAKEK